MGIEKWSTTAADNVVVADGGAPERHDRDKVNDITRTQNAAIRAWYEDAEWVDLLQSNLDDFAVSRISSTQFRVADVGGTDASSKFPVGSWVKVVGTGSPSVAFGRVASIAYSAPNLDVTLAGIVDASYASSNLPSSTVTQVLCFLSRRTREAAFHPVGATLAQTPAQIPTIDDLGDGAALDMGSGGGFDADTVDGHHASDFQVAGAIDENLLVNGGFDVWQRRLDFNGATAPDDDTYVADRWIFLHEAGAASPNNPFDVKKTTLLGFAPALGAPIHACCEIEANGNLTASPSSEKFGLLQIVRSQVSAAAIGKGKASASFWLLNPTTTGIANMRAAILEWTGAPDAVTSDLVTAWGAEGANPSLAASWAYISTPAAIPADSAWVEVKIENATVSSTARNLALFIWADDKSFSATDIVRVTGAKLEAGVASTPYKPVSFEAALAACEPYYCKTYDHDDAPGSVTTNGEIEHPASRLSNFAANEAILPWRFPRRMRAAPTVTIYSPLDGATGNVGANGSNQAASAIGTGEAGTNLQVTGNPAVGKMSAHATAVAEL